MLLHGAMHKMNDTATYTDHLQVCNLSASGKHIHHDPMTCLHFSIHNLFYIHRIVFDSRDYKNPD